MKKLIRHIRRWNKWRKHYNYSYLHKTIVLLGIIKSPSMALIMLPEEVDEIYRSLELGISAGRDIKKEVSG